MNNIDKQAKYADRFRKGEKVLEFGSGMGDFLELCAQKGINAVGVDKNGAVKPGFRIIKSDIPKYLKTAGSSVFSGVYARHIVEHFAPEELKRVFIETRRVLKKGGKIIIIFPNLRNINVATYEFWNDVTHKRPYTENVIIEMLENSGYKVSEHGPDKESWDGSFMRKTLRYMRYILSGIKNQPPDYYVIAEK